MLLFVLFRISNLFLFFNLYLSPHIMTSSSLHIVKLGVVVHVSMLRFLLGFLVVLVRLVNLHLDGSSINFLTVEVFDGLGSTILGLELYGGITL